MPGLGRDAALEKIGRKGIETEFAFLLLLAMAFKAMLLKDREDLGWEIDRSGASARRAKNGEGQSKDTRERH